jgi:Family of unknown function (DUF6221)
MDMGAVIAFFEARLGEMENRARYSGPGLVAWLSLHDEAGELSYTTVAASDHGDGDDWIADGKVLPVPASAHVIYDPAREVRKAEAIRAIVRRCTRYANEMDEYPNALVSPRAVLARQVLMDLGDAWSDHPDYPAELKP